MEIKKIDRRLIETLDKNNMYETLVNFPGQCQQAWSLGKIFRPPKRFRNVNNIVFAGMGGSAISGLVLKSYLQDKIDIPVEVVQNYRLPHFVNKDTLLFIISYSGNTEETLAVYKEAYKRKVKIIAVTSGGELELLAQKHNKPLISIPAGFPPRTALGYLLIPPLLVLEKLHFIGKQGSYISDSIDNLNVLTGRFSIENKENRDNLALNIAGKLYGHIPLVYGTFDITSAVAYRWKTQLAENSKMLAFNHSFPELDHNEIVGWQAQNDFYKNFIIVILKDKDDHRRNKTRIEITGSLLKDCAHKIVEIDSEGKSYLSRLFSLIILGDFVSFYLALINGVNPTPVEKINLLKEKLTQA